jgi:hypothetical protein
VGVVAGVGGGSGFVSEPIFVLVVLTMVIFVAVVVEAVVSAVELAVITRIMMMLSSKQRTD